MVMPFHRVNVLSGTKSAIVLEQSREYAAVIRQAKRPLLVLGPRLTEEPAARRSLLQYAIDLTKTAGMAICATANVKGKMAGSGARPDSEYDLVEIVNHLKHPDWRGARGEGNHDLVVFLGIRTDLLNQCLSTLKHFAPHLRTMTLDKYSFPNADYTLPNYREDEDWRRFLDDLLLDLNEEV